MTCVICEHRHESTRQVTIVKANRREIILMVCAFCALMLAGEPGYHP
jgi:hypothetical protein